MGLCVLCPYMHKHILHSKGTVVGCAFVQYTKQINVHLLFVAYKYVCMHACTHMYVRTVHWLSPQTVSIHLFSPSVEMSILLVENIVDCILDGCLMYSVTLVCVLLGDHWW